ncbi:LacI family DNA-binding transcriptional regulator [bacterium]|nr:LacI family DNA-binding transcriptional regulator [bacterium]
MKTTLADIAKQAGVSKMTVSRVLSGKGQVARGTRDKINAIIDDIGYQPNWIARSLASNRSMILGVIIPKIEHMFLDNYIAQILSGITDVALKNNYKIMLCPVAPPPEEKQEYINLARTKLLDGMILLKTKIKDPNLESLAHSEFPFVLVNFKKYERHYNFVDSQNIQGARIAVEYLYQKGHRDIAFVSGSMEETNGKDRLKGFEDAMHNLGLSYPPERIVYGNFEKDAAYHISDKLLDSTNLPTAIFCADDYMAIAVMKRIKEKGLKVPKDIAVIGFDDIELSAYVKPALTTIRQPMEELGKNSAQILLDLINGVQTAPIHKLLNVELIERESV